MQVKKIYWDEPNRAGLKPLHISTSGNRYSSLAGVRWIDNYRLVANHNSGLRIAFFDIRDSLKPIFTIETPHRTDDISIKRIGSHLYEIVVSGCWDAAYSIYHLSDEGEVRIKYLFTKKNIDRTFSHGVSYSREGKIFVTYSTGENPRIELEEKIWVLPKPWGPRFVSYCHVSNTYFAVCNSTVPKLNAYKTVDASIWIFDTINNTWLMKFRLPNVHSDSCQYFQGKIWIPDQLGNRIFAIDLDTSKYIVLESKSIDFPHGISISELGVLAVTNYGDSSIALIDIKELSK